MVHLPLRSLPWIVRVSEPKTSSKRLECKRGAVSCRERPIRSLKASLAWWFHFEPYMSICACVHALVVLSSVFFDRFIVSRWWCHHHHPIWFGSILIDFTWLDYRFIHRVARLVFNFFKQNFKITKQSTFLHHHLVKSTSINVVPTTIMLPLPIQLLCCNLVLFFVLYQCFYRSPVIRQL